MMTYQIQQSKATTSTSSTSMRHLFSSDACGCGAARQLEDERGLLRERLLQLEEKKAQFLLAEDEVEDEVIQLKSTTAARARQHRAKCADLEGVLARRETLKLKVGAFEAIIAKAAEEEGFECAGGGGGHPGSVGVAEEERRTDTTEPEEILQVPQSSEEVNDEVCAAGATSDALRFQHRRLRELSNRISLREKESLARVERDRDERKQRDDELLTLEAELVNLEAAWQEKKALHDRAKLARRELQNLHAEGQELDRWAEEIEAFKNDENQHRELNCTNSTSSPSSKNLLEDHLQARIAGLRHEIGAKIDLKAAETEEAELRSARDVAEDVLREREAVLREKHQEGAVLRRDVSDAEEHRRFLRRWQELVEDAIGGGGFLGEHVDGAGAGDNFHTDEHSWSSFGVRSGVASSPPLNKRLLFSRGGRRRDGDVREGSPESSGTERRNSFAWQDVESLSPILESPNEDQRLLQRGDEIKEDMQTDGWLTIDEYIRIRNYQTKEEEKCSVTSFTRGQYDEQPPASLYWRVQLVTEDARDEPSCDPNCADELSEESQMLAALEREENEWREKCRDLQLQLDRLQRRL
mmetsp:Transcript_8474/g.20398  ORF Transcript_8474/g.20398 Transcript_8474/m.20398 type:complete len:583 (-) Transcript_8474:73-1821(-)